MSWLEHRWRVQWNVRSVVTCRSPRTNKSLNADGACGTFLQASLLQCHPVLPLLLQASWPTVCAYCVPLASAWEQRLACEMSWSSVLQISWRDPCTEGVLICWWKCSWDFGGVDYHKTWIQASKPAEFKHISKWREKKLKRIPSVMANETGSAHYGNQGHVALTCCLWMHCQLRCRCKPLGKECHWGWESRLLFAVLRARCAIWKSRFLGLERKEGGKFHLKLNIGSRPIAHKYHEGKMKRTLKRELKVPETAERKVHGTSCSRANVFCTDLWYC